MSLWGLPKLFQHPIQVVFPRPTEVSTVEITLLEKEIPHPISPQERRVLSRLSSGTPQSNMEVG